MTRRHQHVRDWWSGDTKQLYVLVLDEDRRPLDLTGATFVYHLTTQIGSAAVITKTNSDGITVENGNGINDRVVISFAPSDTASLSGVFYHELQATDSAGNVATLFVGEVTIETDMVP